MARRSPHAGIPHPHAAATRLRRLSARLLPVVAFCALILVLSLAPGLPAGAKTGLPVPRFVSLRSDEANLRTGPGTNYPVEWVYVRRHMPVEIIAEFDTWRKIRDWQGTEGWVHQSLLEGERTGIVTDAAVQDVLSDPRSDARIVARLEPGVIVRLAMCGPDWCRVAVAGFEGWLRRGTFWGVFPDETFE